MPKPKKLGKKTETICFSLVQDGFCIVRGFQEFEHLGIFILILVQVHKQNMNYDS